MAEPAPVPAGTPVPDPVAAVPAVASPAPSGEGSHAAVPAPAAPGRAGPREPGHRRPVLRAVLLAVAVTAALLLLAGVFLVRMFHVPSTSMEPTLTPGDRVAVDLLAPGPLALRRGDVVVFADTKAWLSGTEAEAADPVQAMARVLGLGETRGHLVKRVVGLPGDRVQWEPGWDHLRVNGVDVAEPYLADGLAGDGAGFDVTVPPGRLWVLGDHRAASQDSRQHRDGPGGGFVALEDVVGRVEAVVWPLDRIGGAGAGTDAFAAVPDGPDGAGA